ncbi:MAG TPA: metallophosphoesterase [Vicinamibacterales bacterium]|nr:metallophosphoesterase [Vicinamibacterales bacterium]
MPEGAPPLVAPPEPRRLSPIVEQMRQESGAPVSSQPTADRTFVERPSLIKVAASDPDAHSQTILVCPDTHVPYHDPVAWAVFIAAAKKLRPDVLVIIGDFADCESISSHTKDPQRRQLLVDELDVVREKLDELGALRIPRTIWTEGNHEFRLKRAVAERAPELDGMVRTLEEYVGVPERGIEWVPYRRGVNIGRMLFTHDVGRCGVYAARQSLLDVGGNVCFGHSHRAAVAYQGTTKGEGHVSLNVGWLGSYDDIGYLHQVRARRDWQHAFAVIDLDETGCVWGQVIPIVNGGAMVRGQKVAA